MMLNCSKFPLGTRNCYAITNSVGWKSPCALVWKEARVNVGGLSVLYMGFSHGWWGKSSDPSGQFQVKNKILFKKKIISQSRNRSQSCIKVKHWTCLTDAPKILPVNRGLQSCRTDCSESCIREMLMLSDDNSRRKSWLVFLASFWAWINEFPRSGEYLYLAEEWRLSALRICSCSTVQGNRSG